MTTTEVLLTGLHFGEGPRWHQDRLWFSDFYRHGIFTVDLDGTETPMLDVPTQPSGLGWLPDGDLLFVSMLDRVLRRQGADGTVSVYADLSGVAPGPCNDMVVAADGTAYVGNFGFDRNAGEDYRSTALAIVDPDGSVRRGPDELEFPNGTVISPDGRQLVIAESFANRLSAFTVGPDGSLSDRRLFADLGSRVPDGICLDADGGVWVADPRNASCFRVVDGGEVTHHIDLEMNCFACMLGGSDRRTLFMITAPTSGSAAEDNPAGRVEVATVDIPGAGLP